MSESKIIIKSPSAIDLSEFKKDKTNVTKYGLPAEIKFCKKCVISNQRPNSAVEFKHTENSKKTTINLFKRFLESIYKRKRRNARGGCKNAYKVSSHAYKNSAV